MASADDQIRLLYGLPPVPSTPLTPGSMSALMAYAPLGVGSPNGLRVNNILGFGTPSLGGGSPMPATNMLQLAAANSGAPARQALTSPLEPEPVAAGDLPCQTCASGGNYGTTGMYSVGGRALCYQCAAKKLGVGNLPGSEQGEIMTPYLLRKPR